MLMLADFNLAQYILYLGLSHNANRTAIMELFFNWIAPIMDLNLGFIAIFMVNEDE